MSEPVEKLSVSLAPELASWARTHAKLHNQSVSGVIAEALERAKRAEALGALLRDLDAEFGALSEDELRAADRAWTEAHRAAAAHSEP